MMFIKYCDSRNSPSMNEMLFYNSETGKLEFTIVSSDSHSNGPSGETKTYKSRYTRNIAIEGGEFDGVIIVFEVPVEIIQVVLFEVCDKLTDEITLRRFMINILEKKWVYPDGFVRK